MHNRPLGSTGLEVSEVGFGCGWTAGFMIRGDREAWRRGVARATELGINFFDTSPVYGDGRSEEHLGQAIRDVGVRPLISTKVMLRTEELDGIPGAVTRSAEASLKRLQVDCIDVFLLHNFVSRTRSDAFPGVLSVADITGPGGVADALDALRRRGVIRSTGFTGQGDVPAIIQLIESGRFGSVQLIYHVMNPTAGMTLRPGFRFAEFDRAIDRAAAQGMGVVAIRPLAGGALGGKLDEPERRPPPGSHGDRAWLEIQADVIRAKAYEFLPEEGQTMAQAAIRFVLTKPEISTVLVGVGRFEDIEPAAVCSDFGPLPSHDLDRLQEIYAHTIT